MNASRVAGSSERVAVPDEQLMVTEARAASIIGFSVRRLRAWSARGLVTPAVEKHLSVRNVVRLYGFAELVELRVAQSLLDDGRSPQQIRRVVEHLRLRDYEAPLRELRFAVSADQIFFQHPDGTWEGDARPDQTVLASILDLDAIRDQVRHAVTARRDRSGTFERRRGVVGSKPTFVGTRVPLAAVEPYLRRGLPDDRILSAFPILTPADVAAAREALTAV